MKQRILCMLLSIAIVFTSVDLSVFAAEVKDVIDTISEIDVGKEDVIEEISDISLSINSTVSDNSVSDSEDIILDDNSKVQTTSLETSGQCGDNLIWRIENETLVISGTGAMWDYEDSKEGQTLAPWSAFEEQLTTLVLEEGIAYIGERAFEGCSCFEGQLLIPNTVTAIGNSAFQSCLGIEELVLSNNLKTIGNHAFVGCFRLKGRLEIPNGVEEIGYHAFANCTGFNGDLIIPSSVKVVGSHAFYYCSGIDGVVKIESKDILLSDRVFYGTAVDTIYGFKGTDAEEYAIAHDLQFRELDTGEVLEGSGTENDPYIISSVDEFSYFMRKVNAGETFAGKYFVLDRNVYLNDISNYSQWSDEYAPDLVWDGIDGFAGIFDGQNHTIYGLYMKQDKDNVGFFNEFNHQLEVIVKNINFENAYVSGGNNVGTIVGKADYVRIENCSVNGVIKGTGENVGGLVGYSGSAGHYGTKIYDSINNAIVNGSNYVGGFIGQTYIGNFHGIGYENVGGSEKLILQRCINNGKIIGTGDYVGGITGSLSRWMNCGGTEIAELTNKGEVVGKDCVGGITGIASSWTANSEEKTDLNYCCNEGNITGENYVGGIIGQAKWSGGGVKSVNNSYNAGIITANNSDAGGIYGRVNQGNETHLCFNVGRINASTNACALVGHATCIGADYAVINNSYYLKDTASKSIYGNSRETNVKDLSKDEMKQKESFEGFNFGMIWEMGEKWPVLNVRNGIPEIIGSENFNMYLYHAEKLKDESNGIVKSLNQLLYELDSASRVFVKALQESGVPFWMGVWETLSAFFGASEDISKIYDLAIEEKDIYAAVILDSLEKNTDYGVVDTCEKVIEGSKEFLNYVEKISKAKYGYNIFEDNEWNTLSTEQRKELIDLTEAFFDKDFDKDLDSLNKVFKNFDTFMKGADCIEAYFEKISESLAVAQTGEEMKEVLRIMYQECSASKVAMKLALADCVEIIDASTGNLLNKIILDEMKVVGVGMAQYLVKELWDEVKDLVVAKWPTTWLFWEAYKVGKLLSNALSNVDEVIEQYHNMIAILEYEDLAIKAYEVLKSKYFDNKDSKSAAIYLASINYIFSVMDIDCIKAYKFLDALDDAWISKIGAREELKRVIVDMRKMYYTCSENINTFWISYLLEDYPESGLYEKYEYLWIESEKRIADKEFLIQCPVDVYVYDASNSLVGSVINNVPDCSGNLTIAVEGDSKIIQFYGDEEYTLKCVGNDNGTMDITVVEYKDNKEMRNVEYYDIPLQVGSSYETCVSTEIMDVTEYRFTEGDGDNIVPDYDSAMQNEQKYNAVINAGTFRTQDGIVMEMQADPNENIEINAYITEGKQFVEWSSTVGNYIFENPNEASTHMRMPNENVIVTAILKDANNNLLVTDLYLDKDNVKMLVGETLQLQVTITPDNATNKNVFWKSSDESVIKIDENGMLQAIGKGVAEIIVSSEDDKCKARCIVTVEKNNEDDEQSNNKELDNFNDKKNFEENNIIEKQQEIVSRKVFDKDTILEIQTTFNNFAYIENNKDVPKVFEGFSEVEKTEDEFEYSHIENEQVDTEENNESELNQENLMRVVLLVGLSLAVFISIIILKTRNNKQ